MKTKNLGLFFVGVFATILLVSFVSATITFSNVPELSKSGSSFTFRISSNQNETITFLSINPINQSGQSITFDLPSPITLNDTTPQSVTVNYDVPSAFNFLVGKTYSTPMKVSGDVSGEKTQTLTFEKSGYCEARNSGDISIDIKDVTVKSSGDKKSFGDDEEWYAGDNVEIELKIENEGNDDLDNIEVEWVLLNDKGDEIMDDKEKDFDLKDGKDKTLTITLELDPDDFSADDTNLVFRVRATGENKETNEDVCGEDSQNIDLQVDDNFVILSNIKAPEVVQCNQQLQINAEVWNIGDEDEEDVEVRIFNSDLKLDQKVNIGDVDSFDSEKFLFTYTTPKNIKEGIYTFRLSVLDDNGDVFENDNNDDAEFTKSIKIEGGCEGSSTGGTSSVVVAAKLESEGKAGKDLTIRATVTNQKSTLANYELNAAGFGDWATLTSIEPSVLVLAPGESKDVVLTFKVNKGISGEKTFGIEVISNRELVLNQPVSVSIEGSGFGGIDLGENWYLWLIGALNVLLVVIIIVVAVRVSKSK